MTDADRKPAEIYAFPGQGRCAAGAKRSETDAAMRTTACVTVAGEAWYHAEAIDAERPRKN